MADFNKRGPGDCDDECGEGGERGKRGKRGHRGHDGRDGAMGATGPTGPASSGGGPVVTDPNPPTLVGDGTDASPLQVINVAPQPFSSPDAKRVIFANQNGNDETGDGTEGNPYRTLQQAVLDVPLFIPGGVSYDVNITGLGQETLPDGFELPCWKASLGYFYDNAQPFFPIVAAVNISADPKLSSFLSPANAIIAPADLVATEVGGGITDVQPFNDVRNSGTGNGTTDSFADEGDGIASLQIAGEDFDGEVSLITITGSPSPANDGTFPVVGTDGDKVFYENPAVVAEAGFGGTYETFTPFIFVETTNPHGLWNVEFPVQVVTLDGVLGSIGAVANGEHTARWRTFNTFIFQIDEDATSLVYGGGGTVEVLFVQDPDSGNVQIRTNKNFGANDSLVQQFVIMDNFFQGVIYKNTVDTLFISLSFAPNSFGVPVSTIRVMEQSAELLTTCSFASTGSRRGPHRGGLTIANVDSMALNGVKVTPLNEGEVGLCQEAGSLITQICHLTTPAFNSAQTGSSSACSYMTGATHKGSPIDLERCFYENPSEPTNNDPIGWAYAYFGTVFHNQTFSYDAPIQVGLFACKFIDQGPIYVALGGGRTDLDSVSFENIEGFVMGASSAITRNAITRVNGTRAAPDVPCTLSLNGGTFLVRSDNAPYGDASFTNPGDFMIVDGLPARTYEDFRQHALLDLTPLTANFDTVFEAIFPYTSTPIPFFGDPPYPSIQTIGDSGAGVNIIYNSTTGLVEIHFQPGVSTVLDAETAIAAFAWPDAGGIRVKVSGTPGNILVAGAGPAGDEIPATLLDVGVNGPCGEYTNIRANPKTGTLDCPGPLGTQSTVIAYSLS
jgi:hypothetical protein